MSERKWRSSPIPQGSKRKLDHRQRIQALIVALRKRTGEEHRAIHARINRASGAPSVGAATREQLERGNDLLSRWLRGS